MGSAGEVVVVEEEEKEKGCGKIYLYTLIDPLPLALTIKL